MRHRKKIGKHRRHSRRRVGAAAQAGSFIEMALGVIGGAVIGRVAYTSISLPQYVMGALQVVIGGGAGFFGAKMPLVQGLGLGLLGNGAVVVGEETSVIQGIAGVMDKGIVYNPQRRVNGYRDVPKVGDFPKPNAVGRTDQMMGRIYKGVY